MRRGRERLLAPSRLVLVPHIAAGTVALVLGPVAMAAWKRPSLHTQAGSPVIAWVTYQVGRGTRPRLPEQGRGR